MERKIGVYICHCGTNISPMVDVEAVTEFAQELPFVTIARNYKYMCSDLCPFHAISLDEEKKVCQVNETLCKGCGVCVAACPSGAIVGRHFTTEELMAEIEGVLV